MRQPALHTSRTGYVGMTIMRNLLVFLLVTLLVICGYYYVDARIALFVNRLWISDARLAVFSANIPDFLLPLVCVITGFAWTAYFHLVRKGVFNTQTRFFQLVAITIPLTFSLKSMLKLLVGRINTRFWLRHPTYSEFHWFHGIGNYTSFPSGHMAVFTTFMVALWKFYPRHRTKYVLINSAVALALVLTNYHFVSDIVAGVYVGFIVHTVTLHGIQFLLKSEGSDQRGAL